MSPRTGRPKVEHPRSEIRRIRYTQAEDEAIIAAAAKAETTVVEWLRKVTLAAAKYKPSKH